MPIRAIIEDKEVTVVSITKEAGNDYIYYYTSNTNLTRKYIDWDKFDIQWLDEKDNKEVKERWSKLKKYILSDSGPLDRFELLRKIEDIENGN